MRKARVGARHVPTSPPTKLVGGRCLCHTVAAGSYGAGADTVIAFHSL